MGPEWNWRALNKLWVLVSSLLSLRTRVACLRRLRLSALCCVVLSRVDSSRLCHLRSRGRAGYKTVREQHRVISRNIVVRGGRCVHERQTTTPSKRAMKREVSAISRVVFKTFKKSLISLVFSLEGNFWLLGGRHSLACIIFHYIPRVSVLKLCSGCTTSWLRGHVSTCLWFEVAARVRLASADLLSAYHVAWIREYASIAGAPRESLFLSPNVLHGCALQTLL